MYDVISPQSLVLRCSAPSFAKVRESGSWRRDEVGCGGSSEKGGCKWKAEVTDSSIREKERWAGGRIVQRQNRWTESVATGRCDFVAFSTAFCEQHSLEVLSILWPL